MSGEHAGGSMKPKRFVERVSSYLHSLASKSHTPQIQLTERDLAAARIAADAICWVLGHGHPTRLEALLVVTQQAFRHVGVEVDLEGSEREYLIDTIRRLPVWAAELVRGNVATIEEAAIASRVNAAYELQRLRLPTGTKCIKCGSSHGLDYPHNPFAQFFRVASRARDGLNPSWIDAIEDCPEWSQKVIMPILRRYKQWPWVGTKSIPLLEEIQHAIEKAGQEIRRTRRKK